MMKAAGKLIVLLLWILAWCAPVWLAKKTGRIARRDAMVISCYRGILWFLGIRLTVSGALARERPLLLVTNHLSYVDVFLLGSAVPVRFAPKNDIAKWPLIGGICRMCDVVFIDRRPGKIKQASGNMQAALARGEVVCLFPEGTTSNGLQLLPFKSSFFALAGETFYGRVLTIQPAAICYRQVNGAPISAADWPNIAWYGDMALLPHLLKLLQQKSIEAEIVFLPPLDANKQADRKQLAAHCRQLIATHVAKMA